MYIMWIFLLQQHLRYVVLVLPLPSVCTAPRCNSKLPNQFAPNGKNLACTPLCILHKKLCANAKTQRPLHTTIGKLLRILRAVAKKTLQETCVLPANAPTLSTSQLPNTQFLKIKHLENSLVAPFNCNRQNKSPQSTFPQETRQAGGFFS